MSEKNSLAIPSAALEDDLSFELARIWAADNRLNCALRIGAFQEEGHDEVDAWGVVISDLIRHASRAYVKEFGGDENDICNAMIKSFLNEIDAPTSGIKTERE